MLQGLATIILVPWSATYEEQFKALEKNITTPAKARATLKIIINPYIEIRKMVKAIK